MQEMLLAVIPAIGTAVAGYFAATIRAKQADHDRQIKEAEETRKAAEAAARERDKAMRAGLMALLQREITFIHEQCVKNGRFVPVNELPMIDSMYEAYATMGGDGIVKRLYDNLIGMKHVKIEEG